MQQREHSCYFSAAHAAKDSGIALDLARAAHQVLPLAEATKRQYDRMVASSLGELDKSGIAELTFRGRAGASGSGGMNVSIDSGAKMLKVIEPECQAFPKSAPFSREARL